MLALLLRRSMELFIMFSIDVEYVSQVMFLTGPTEKARGGNYGDVSRPL